MRVWNIGGAKMMASTDKKRQWVEVHVTMMGDSYIIAVALPFRHPARDNTYIECALTLDGGFGGGNDEGRGRRG